jgi:FAD/FMN-containing dehydrogenase
MNFGFWDTVPTTKEPGHYNRLIEEKVAKLGGRKGLYSDAFYPKEEFDRIYNMRAYARLKAKYDPQRRFKGLYEKCVLRA